MIETWGFREDIKDIVANNDSDGDKKDKEYDKECNNDKGNGYRSSGY